MVISKVYQEHLEVKLVQRKVVIPKCVFVCVCSRRRSAVVRWWVQGGC